MKVGIVDNMDSFVYNLYHYIKQLTDNVEVYRINQFDWEDLDTCDALVLSPGPSLPTDNPLLIEIVKKYGAYKKILGVCLGHQAIALAYGSALLNLDEVLHGLSKPSFVMQTKNSIFNNLPIKLECARYHSWVIHPDKLAADLEVTAYDDHGHIMAIQHKEFDVHGVQFHPESIMTEKGMQMIENWFEF